MTLWACEHMPDKFDGQVDEQGVKEFFLYKFFEIWIFFSENHKLKNQNTSFKLINQS